MTIPYFDRPTPSVKKGRRREVNKRYREKHRDILLYKKREYASKPSTLERRRYLYQVRRNDPAPPEPPLRPVTLDAWARECGHQHAQ